MKRVLIVFLMVLLAFAAVLPRLHAAEPLRGVWTATASDVSMQLQMWRGNSQNGNRYPLAAFRGLTEAQIGAVSETPVQFELPRDAGTFRFDGTFKQRDGAGHFAFEPNLSFPATLRSLGVAFEDSDEHRRPLEERLLTLAMLDVSADYIRSMQAAGYRTTLKEYTEMRIFNVTPALINELASLGYKDLSSRQLVTTQIHGAKPDFIRALAAEGYRGLSLDQLVTFRIHGVSIDFIRELRDLGYTNISANDLVRMRIHGVTPSFIRELRDAGYANVPVSKLVDLRIHGVDANFIKRMNH
jgi:hypothetical protein